MSNGSALFQNGDLSTTLHHQLRGLRQRVEARFRPDLDISDEQLASEIAAQARFQPLVVDFDSLEKDVTSERLVIRDYGREIEVDGVRVTFRFAFSGDPALFYLQPNSYWSMVPYGVIERGTIAIGVTGANDPARIKQELESQVDLLKKYLGAQNEQIEQYNQQLAVQVIPLIAAFRQSAEKLDALRKAL
jgi:hypothetical protein